MTELQGSSWGHTRGHDPLVAAAARYAAERGVAVEWTPRTLTEFGVMDVGELANAFDLVVIDHPHVGGIAASGSLVPLDDLLDAERIAPLGVRSPGSSHASYVYEGHQWALALDAACQVAAWRPDRLDETQAPRTWADVAELARDGRVIWPLNPVDAQASFLTTAAALGTPLDGTGQDFIDPAAGVAVLEAMHAVARHLDPRCFELNAIGALEALATEDDGAAYCPLVFGYTNYARDGYRARRLRFADIVAIGDADRGPRGALLGGVGIGVSARSANAAAAAEFALWVAGPEIQRTTFFAAGGQPAHVAAWDDAALDAQAGGFFSGTRATLESAWMRPRMPGFVAWQNASLPIVHEALRSGTGFARAVERLNALAPATAGRP
jgi:multiple sugar transport system substrate-binding protein